MAVDIETGDALRYGPGEASGILEVLRAADTTVGYNSSSFDLGVLSAYGDVEPIQERHIDICAIVRETLEALPEAQAPGVGRLRQGGLNGLAKANGLKGKTGEGTDAPALYREGRIQKLFDYCEPDVRLVADLYRMARGRGFLHVDPYHHDAERRRIYLPRTTIPLSL